MVDIVLYSWVVVVGSIAGLVLLGLLFTCCCCCCCTCCKRQQPVIVQSAMQR